MNKILKTEDVNDRLSNLDFWLNHSDSEGERSFINCVIKDVNFTREVLEFCYMYNCTFDNCTFEDTCFTACSLENLKFYNCNFKEDSLTFLRSDISIAQFADNKFIPCDDPKTKITFKLCVMKHVEGLDLSQVNINNCSETGIE